MINYNFFVIEKVGVVKSISKINALIILIREADKFATPNKTGKLLP